MAQSVNSLLGIFQGFQGNKEASRWMHPWTCMPDRYPSSVGPERF